jgi:hypothetical protein
MMERFLHWILKARKKHCKHCCMVCEYYNVCRLDEE